MAEKISFEKSITRLDALVKKLEQGDATLDESLALFEEGTKLIKKLSKMLDEAEQKVVLLTKGKDGEPIETEFEEEVGK